MAVSVLFVCLGNICRSTMAEAVMRHRVEQEELADRITVDSAGTGNYHIGEKPHSGTRAVLDRHGISYAGITARQISEPDLDRFDHVIAMDESNHRDILRLCTSNQQKKVHLLSDFVQGCAWTSVPDPWFTGNFEETFQLVTQGCIALLEHIRTEAS